jgi:hypothetical protein
MQDQQAICALRDALVAMMPRLSRMILETSEVRTRKGIENAILEVLILDKSIYAAMELAGLLDDGARLQSSAKAMSCELVNRIADGIPKVYAVRRCVRVGIHHLLSAAERRLSEYCDGKPNIAMRLCLLMAELDDELGAEFEFKARYLAREMRNGKGRREVLPDDVDRVKILVEYYFPELVDSAHLVERALSDALLETYAMATARFVEGEPYLPSRFIAEEAKTEFRHKLMSGIEDAV